MSLRTERQALRKVDRNDFEAVTRQRDEARADRDRYHALLVDLVATTDLRGAPESIKARMGETLRAASSREQS